MASGNVAESTVRVIDPGDSCQAGSSSRAFWIAESDNKVAILHHGAMSDAPARDREVVAGAIFREGRLLLAQRTSPPALAGRWELPGGKVEEFESPQNALARELLEELAVEVRCGARIGVDVPLSPGLVLRAYRAELVSGEPVALHHAQLTWVDAEELLSMDLVDNDRAWIPELLAELSALTPHEPS